MRRLGLSWLRTSRPSTVGFIGWTCGFTVPRAPWEGENGLPEAPSNTQAGVGGEYMAKETAKLLEAVDTELGELGETIQKALDRGFEEEYEVVNVLIDSEGMILVSINLVEVVDED